LFAYESAQTYEASLDDETVQEFNELALFDSPGLDGIGLALGIMLAGIYVLNRGGFENFTRREQIVNVLVGLGVLAMLIPLMGVVESSFVATLVFWAASPLIVGLAVPAVGRWLVGRF